MTSEENKKISEFIGKKRKASQLTKKNFEDKVQLKGKKNGIIRITYTLEENSHEETNYIRLFGEKFTKKNKNNCKMIIAQKEYKIISVIDIEESKENDITVENEKLEIILKVEQIEDMSDMFCSCKRLIDVDFSLFSKYNKYVKNVF